MVIAFIALLSLLLLLSIYQLVCLGGAVILRFYVAKCGAVRQGGLETFEQ